jgi:hypothetical protein
VTNVQTSSTSVALGRAAINLGLRFYHKGSVVRVKVIWSNTLNTMVSGFAAVFCFSVFLVIETHMSFSASKGLMEPRIWCPNHIPTTDRVTYDASDVDPLTQMVRLHVLFFGYYVTHVLNIPFNKLDRLADIFATPKRCQRRPGPKNFAQS